MSFLVLGRRAARHLTHHSAYGLRAWPPNWFARPRQALDEFRCPARRPAPHYPTFVATPAAAPEHFGSQLNCLRRVRPPFAGYSAMDQAIQIQECSEVY